MGSLSEQAAEFARAAHQGQTRGIDGAPRFDHVAEVARLVERSGFGEEVVAAAFLHDVLEKTDVAIEEIRELFGDAVARLAAALTDDDGIRSYRERKAAHRARAASAGEDAIVILVADKISNARSLAAALDREGAGLDDRLTNGSGLRLEHYERTLGLAHGETPSLPLLADLEAAVASAREALDAVSGAGRQRSSDASPEART